MEGKRGNYIALAVTLSALGALLLCSQAALESARAGLNLCAQMIVPSLLPFFILSSLLQQRREDKKRQQRRHDHLRAEVQPRARTLERRL